MTFKIEKGFKTPSSRSKYPFPEMKVGDSFLINGGTHPRTVAAAAYTWGCARTPPHKFSIRKTPKGFRLWRVA